MNKLKILYCVNKREELKELLKKAEAFSNQESITVIEHILSYKVFSAITISSYCKVKPILVKAFLQHLAKEKILIEV